MSEAKFTQGEWVAYYPHKLLNYGNVSLETEDGRLISMVAAYKSDLVEKTANAHLIAAAPKMYAMLEQLSNSIPTVCENHEQFCLRIQINELLAEARGEK